MSFSETQLTAWFAAFIWPLMRVGAVVISAPIFSSRQTPKIYSIGLILLLTWVLIPVIPAPPVVSLFSYQAFVMALQQLLIGMSMGFILQMVFAALVFGGQALAYSMGLGFAP